MHQVLEEHSVLVKGEHIREVASASEFEGFAGKRIDFSGGTLLPGLIDCHVHLIYGGEGDPKSKVGGAKPGDLVMRALDRAQESLRSGVTSLRDLGGQRLFGICGKRCLQLRPPIGANYFSSWSNDLYDWWTR